MKKILGWVLSFIFSVSVLADSSQEKTVSSYFDSIKNDPLKIYIFLNDFPKGGDLHNHFSGATFAENLINYAKNDHFCVDDSFTLTTNAQCLQNRQLINAQQYPNFYRNIVDQWSMNDFIPGAQSGETHFFATFLKFNLAIGKHPSEILAEILHRAGAEHIKYLELLIDANDIGLSENNSLLANVATLDFSQARSKLLAQQDFTQWIKQISARISTVEQQAKKQLHCGEVSADPGCNVTVRYQYFALREFNPAQVFTELLTGFELAKNDPRFVGVNIVMAEDGPIAIKDYDLHMKMFNYLHQVYPEVGISLHAGELSPTSVPPERLRTHIRQAIEVGQAQRIGHGVDVAYELNAQQLLKEMANKQIMVEVNLTSNQKILGVAGEDHPFPLYLKYQVPVTLSTDDEGVLRTNLVHEYQEAALRYHLSYATLKKLSRNSLTYSFLPGKSLWQHPNSEGVAPECSNEILGSDKPSVTCQEFLVRSEKARLQWKLEQDFQVFENNYQKN